MSANSNLKRPNEFNTQMLSTNKNCSQKIANRGKRSAHFKIKFDDLNAIAIIPRFRKIQRRYFFFIYLFQVFFTAAFISCCFYLLHELQRRVHIELFGHLIFLFFTSSLLEIPTSRGFVYVILFIFIMVQVFQFRLIFIVHLCWFITVPVIMDKYDSLCFRLVQV